jgi:hypothetical protein
LQYISSSDWLPKEHWCSETNTPNTEIMTHINEVFPKKSYVRDNLVDAGYSTLESCGQAGTFNLLKVRSCGNGTVLALRNACYVRHIPWIKCESEQVHLTQIEGDLQKKYGLPQHLAHTIAEIYFQEGWSHPPLNKSLK